jgi:hypothetical protein
MICNRQRLGRAAKRAHKKPCPLDKTRNRGLVQKAIFGGMTGYRMYRLDAAGRIATAPLMLDCEDDAEALSAAARDAEGAMAEIWDMTRLMGIVGGTGGRGPAGAGQAAPAAASAAPSAAPKARG